jgi:predicted CoA-binding protein
MPQNKTIDPLEVLKNGKVVLLVDWPNPQLPRTLLESGFIVFCYSPNGYTRAEIVAEYPHDANQKNIFPLGNKEGFLVFRPVDGPPTTVDIASVYRPEQEHARILTDILSPLGVKCIWLQPPVTSAQTRDLAEKHNLTFIEGHDIATVARRL